MSPSYPPPCSDVRVYDPSGDSTLPTTSKKRKFEETEEQEEEAQEEEQPVQPKPKKIKKEKAAATAAAAEGRDTLYTGLEINLS